MTPLPTTGPEREIILRALREYSESCTMPLLTPGCPFRAETSTGFGCAEECQDLLAECGAPPPVDEVKMGPELALRPRLPRPRRGPDRMTRPYDTAEIHHADSVKPSLHDWRPAALLMELNHLLMSHSAAADRLGRCQGVVDELERRGFQPDSIIRDVMANAIAMSIFFRAISSMSELGAFRDDADADDESDSDTAAWTRFLEDECAAVPEVDIDPPDDAPRVVGGDEIISPEEFRAFAAIFLRLVSTDALRKILAWVRVASLEDLISYRFPGVETLQSLSVPGPDEIIRPGPHLWLYERFMLTYLGDWHRDSLAREWRYLHPSEPAPLARDVMRARLIDEVELAKTIADKVTKDEPPERTRPVGPFIDLALQFMNDGNRRAAAAMFHTLTKWEPDDPEFANNEGFCLLPDDARRALVSLEDAANRGYAARLVNIANRLVALVLLGDHADAVALAERAHDLIIGSDGQGSAWLWGLDLIAGGDPEIVLVEDLRTYIADVALVASRKTGDDEAADRWLERRQLVHQPAAASGG